MDIKLPTLSSLGPSPCPKPLIKLSFSVLIPLMPCMRVKLSTLCGISVLRGYIYSLGPFNQLERAEYVNTGKLDDLLSQLDELGKVSHFLDAK